MEKVICYIAKKVLWVCPNCKHENILTDNKTRIGDAVTCSCGETHTIMSVEF